MERLFKKGFTMGIRSRLFLGFLVATCLTGVVATIVGIKVLNDSTISEVQRKVNQDLNTARLIYTDELRELSSQLRCIAGRTCIGDAVEDNDLSALKKVMVDSLRPCEDEIYIMPDMLSILDRHGRVLMRAFNPGVSGDMSEWDDVIERCLDEGVPTAATEIIKAGHIIKDNPLLAQRLRMDIVETPRAVKDEGKRLFDGMVLRAARPVFDRKGTMTGVLAGGILLNKNYEIVDKIKQTVYRNEMYHGKDIGFATIFQDRVQISTNVPTAKGKRATGTVVSEDVYHKVMDQGEDWTGRAFVVNDWYISAYAPIYNINHLIIGMIYTGILEEKYRDMKLQAIWIFLGITSMGMMVAFIISYFLGNSIIGRFRILKEATENIAAGDFGYQLTESSSSCCMILDEAVNNMARSLKERDDQVKEALEQVSRTGHLAAIGQMAAGVAHEINNPLGGILLYSNLVLENMAGDDPERQNMEKIIYQTDRCKKIVENLLDFARKPSDKMESLYINDVIISTLGLIKDQSAFHDIEIETMLGRDLPAIQGDRSRLEQAFLNIIFNAADAMDAKGRISIQSRQTSSGHVKILIKDTGTGIKKTSIPHLFDPFFTTKDPGKGTGLGLFITYGIIKEHNGIIDVESDDSEGATFIISLPIAPDFHMDTGHAPEGSTTIG
ncbi:MAG: cache domain-containing protein [Thermodesulfobacteriota bacterium]|nr:cache domain-containing protein [Thermodesulfobacteriota bacterium]